WAFCDSSVGEDIKRSVPVTATMAASTNIFGTCVFPVAAHESCGLALHRELALANKFLPSSEPILIYLSFLRREAPCGFAPTPFLPGILRASRTGAAGFPHPRPRPSTLARVTSRSPTECSASL